MRHDRGPVRARGRLLRHDRDRLRGLSAARPQRALRGGHLHGRGRARLSVERHGRDVRAPDAPTVGEPRHGAGRPARPGPLGAVRLPGPAGGGGPGVRDRGRMRPAPGGPVHLVPHLGGRRRHRLGPRGARLRDDRALRRFLRHLPRPVLRLPPRRPARCARPRLGVPGVRRGPVVPEPAANRDQVTGAGVRSGARVRGRRDRAARGRGRDPARAAPSGHRRRDRIDRCLGQPARELPRSSTAR